MLEIPIAPKPCCRPPTVFRNLNNLPSLICCWWSSTWKWRCERGVTMRGSSPAPREPWLPQPRALASKSQADGTALGGFLVVSGLCSWVSLSMAWHGRSEMEGTTAQGRKGSVLLCRSRMNPMEQRQPMGSPHVCHLSDWNLKGLSRCRARRAL